MIEFEPTPARAARQSGAAGREAGEPDEAGAQPPREEGTAGEGARVESGHDGQRAEGGRGMAGGHAVHANPKPVQKGAAKPR